MEPEVVICGAVAYLNTGDTKDKYPIRWLNGKYQALINSRWRNIRVLSFMDYNPNWVDGTL